MRAMLPSLLLLAGCYTGDLDPMEQQPKLQEYEATRHFDDERAMRPLVDGTVPRERDLTGAPKITAELVELGREKFTQICTPCHGLVGDGKGSVAHKFSLRQPPSLHDQRRRGLTSQWIYGVLTEGYGLMPRFTTQLDVRERWAVVAYVRALQRSQDVAYDQLPADLRDELDHPRPKPVPEGEGHGAHGGHGAVEAPQHRGEPGLPPAEKEDAR